MVLKDVEVVKGVPEVLLVSVGVLVGVLSSGELVLLVVEGVVGGVVWGVVEVGTVEDGFEVGVEDGVGVGVEDGDGVEGGVEDGGVEVGGVEVVPVDEVGVEDSEKAEVVDEPVAVEPLPVRFGIEIGGFQSTRFR